MSLLYRLEKALGPDSGFPVLSGMLVVLVAFILAFPTVWFVFWLLSWLPWPGKP